MHCSFLFSAQTHFCESTWVVCGSCELRWGQNYWNIRADTQPHKCVWHATEWCIRCIILKLWLNCCQSQQFMQSILLLAMEKQSSSFSLLLLSDSRSLSHTILNHSRSISFWQSHLFCNILVFELICPAQGIIQICLFFFFSIFYFILFCVVYISIALVPLFSLNCKLMWILMLYILPFDLFMQFPMLRNKLMVVNETWAHLILSILFFSITFLWFFFGICVYFHFFL